MTNERTAPNLLYIMGTGRSGTTILEILLGNSPGVCGIGEAVHVFRDGFQNSETCACGNSLDDCPVWSQVWQDGGWTKDDLAKLVKTQRDFSWHTDFPQILIGLKSRRASRFFATVNSTIVEAAARATNSKVVVDSSKYAGRALALYRSRNGSMKVICMTREPAGLIRAFSRRGPEGEQLPKGPFRVLAYYVYTMTCLRLARLVLGDQCLSITYEQLQSDPQAVLQKIGRWSDIDFSQSCTILAGNETLQPGHIVTGNRLRRVSEIRFQQRAPVSAKLRGTARVAELLMRFWRRLLWF